MATFLRLATVLLLCLPVLVTGAKPLVNTIEPTECLVGGGPATLSGEHLSKVQPENLKVVFGSEEYTVTGCQVNTTDSTISLVAPHVAEAGQVLVLVFDGEEQIGNLNFTFTGENCPGYNAEKRTDCTGAGTCDYATGKCECTDWHFGDACDRINDIPLTPTASKRWWDVYQWYVTVPAVLIFVGAMTVVVIVGWMYRRRKSSQMDHSPLLQTELENPPGSQSPGYHRIG